ncbi:hypothetical protein [Dactylosporangium darangshiense]|uniref:Uncharacterized protein n=1 Tax=Dactylosporangium darangshiense TaxID=579108 RepID=A0ABP8DNM1_9ACTN
MAELLDLGGALREATASLDSGQLQELSGQQRPVVHAWYSRRAASPRLPHQAQTAAERADSRAAELRARLDEAAAEQAEADKTVRARRSEASRIEKKAREAERRLHDATERRRRLAG